MQHSTEKTRYQSDKLSLLPLPSALCCNLVPCTEFITPFSKGSSKKRTKKNPEQGHLDEADHYISLNVLSLKKKSRQPSHKSSSTTVIFNSIQYLFVYVLVTLVLIYCCLSEWIKHAVCFELCIIQFIYSGIQKTTLNICDFSLFKMENNNFEIFNTIKNLLNIY